MAKTYYVTATVIYQVTGDDDLEEQDAIRTVMRGNADDVMSVEATSVSEDY